MIIIYKTNKFKILKKKIEIETGGKDIIQKKEKNQ